jgi:AhpD family alkylhydroperoxidase
MEDREAFYTRRERQNEHLLAQAGLPVKRFFALDHDVFEDGAIPGKYKELLGLVASTVLRCEDCVTYHMARASDAGATHAEIEEALAIALLVGGSITVPLLRQAFALLETL